MDKPCIHEKKRWHSTEVEAPPEPPRTEVKVAHSAESCERILNAKYLPPIPRQSDPCPEKCEEDKDEAQEERPECRTREYREIETKVMDFPCRGAAKMPVQESVFNKTRFKRIKFPAPEKEPEKEVVKVPHCPTSCERILNSKKITPAPKMNDPCPGECEVEAIVRKRNEESKKHITGEDYCKKLFKKKKKRVLFKEMILKRQSFLRIVPLPMACDERAHLGRNKGQIVFDKACKGSRYWVPLLPPKVRQRLGLPPPKEKKKPKKPKDPPEPRSAYQKTNTHGVILEVGQNYICILEERCRQEIEEALRLQAIELEEECLRRLQEAIERTRNEQQDHCQEVIGTLMVHFDECFREVVQSTTRRLREQCDERVKEERSQVAAYMLEQLEEAVERRDLQLCDDFHDMLENELNALADRFLKQIDAERKVAIEIIRQTIERYERALRDLRMEMETSGMSDICRAVVLERQRCNEHAKLLEARFKEKLKEVYDVTLKLQARHMCLQGLSDETMRRIIYWRNQLKAIVKEFQRFITFALEAMPAHAEFLLSIEKLLLKKFTFDSFLSPREYLIFKECVMKKFTPAEKKESHIISEIEEEKPQMIFSDEGEGEIYILGEERMDPCASYNLMYDYVRAIGNQIPSDEKVESEESMFDFVDEAEDKSTSSSSVDRRSEFYRLLRMVGEEERDFNLTSEEDLQRLRTLAMMKIVKKDPEIAMILLGCS